MENPVEEIIDSLIDGIQTDTGKEVDRMKVLDGEEKNVLKLLIVFEDHSILVADILFDRVGDDLALRIRGNYV